MTLTWTALVFPRFLKKLLWFWFLPRGKCSWMLAGRAQPESSCSPITHPYSTWDQPSINPHLLPSLPSPWHLPALLLESLQDHLMPFLLQPPLLWLLLLCPINQPVYFYLGNLWQEVGSMAHWRVPLVSLLFFFVFLYCLFNGALGAHWMLSLSCTERHD